MRSPALKQIFLLLTLGILMSVTTSQARTPVSIRLIGGLTQSASNAVYNETDDLTPIFGLGVRYALSNRHSLFLDLERIQRWPDFTYALSADTTLSREPLSDAGEGSGSLVVMPVTLGYQFAFASVQDARFTPYLSVGLSAVRLSSPSALSNRYPSLEPGSSETIGAASTANNTWSFGARLGIGCCMRFNSWLSIDGSASYRHLKIPGSLSYSLTGRPDTQQNISGTVFEGTSYDQAPVRSRVGGFEGKLILEFRL